MKELINCPVCNSSDVRYFLHRKGVPVHQNLVMNNAQSATPITRGDLDMVVCHGCGFIYNSSFDQKKLNYCQDYDNTQSHSGFFELYLKGLASHLINERNIKNSRILEVGCGKGVFLKMLTEDASLGNTGHGFDPSYVGPVSDLDGRLEFKREFYGPKFSAFQADTIICRHVIEHVQDPVYMLKTIHTALEESKHARIYFETPCVEWVLKNHVIWDFFYEHCSLFTADSLATAFNTSGFHVSEVRHVFQGQYLWIEARLQAGNQSAQTRSGTIPSLAADFSRDEKKLKFDWQERVKNLGEQGNVALWGAGAKGTTFANLIDPERQYIDCIIDVNPNKQGHYVPGTGHHIVGLDNLASRNLKNAILMNPNYREKNQSLLNEAGLKISLLE